MHWHGIIYFSMLYCLLCPLICNLQNFAGFVCLILQRTKVISLTDYDYDIVTQYKLIKREKNKKKKKKKKKEKKSFLYFWLRIQPQWGSCRAGLSYMMVVWSGGFTSFPTVFQSYRNNKNILRNILAILQLEIILSKRLRSACKSKRSNQSVFSQSNIYSVNSWISKTRN